VGFLFSFSSSLYLVETRFLVKLSVASVPLLWIFCVGVLYGNVNVFYWRHYDSTYSNKITLLGLAVKGFLSGLEVTLLKNFLV